MALAVACCVLPCASVRAQNLLGNPGFESGVLSPWTVAEGSPTIVSEGARSGTRAARLPNARLRQGWITVVPGRSYKAFAWVRIVSESGHDWGGSYVSVMDSNWRTLGTTETLLRATHGGEWFKVAFRFTATTPSVLFEVGYFGGSGRTQVLLVDDCALLEAGGANQPPQIGVSLTPTHITAPATQGYQLLGDDPDGAIVRVVWEFGDGTRAFGWSGTRHVGVPGGFTGRVTALDDEGAVAHHEFTWNATRTGWPQVTIVTGPGEGATVSTPTLEIGGTSSGATQVVVSTDRAFWGEATGTASWNAQVRLAAGWNRITVQARAASGALDTATRRVRYVPAGTFRIGGLTAPAAVQRWDPLEISFELENSAATHPQFPYDPAPPPGLGWVDGVSVEGLFTPDNWRTVYRRPAFLFQPYQRDLRGGEEWLYPSGPPRWQVRFAPPQLGEWKYRIEAREARGTAASEERSFTVTSPTRPTNRGPVRVSPTDPRYFEFADGSTFLGGGHGIGFADHLYSYDAVAKFDAIGAGNQHFFRWWISGHLWGSAWQPWASRTLPYEGTVPPTGLTVDAAYADGLAAWRLDAANPILFQGFMSERAALIPGRTYEVLIRWCTRNVSGPAVSGRPFGVCVKRTGWPEPGETHPIPATVSHVNGDTPWHVARGTFVASDHLLENFAMILENTTGGVAYVDECIVREVAPDGTRGPNLLRTPRANSHATFDPRRGAGLDAILREANDRGLYFKLVISEKAEYLLNRFAPTGLPDPHGNYFNEGPGSPTWWLHAAYWRHLFARYGAFRSVHSWELVNEEAPGFGDHFRLTAELARQAAADGNPHPASTSTWASLAEGAWKHPESAAISYADFHCYVHGTGWIEPRAELAADSARFFVEYDRAAAAAGFGKPVVWGEMGIDAGAGSTDDEEPRLAQDAQGIWLHKILWARCGPGGVYPLYWWTDNIFNRALHPRFGAWHRFMAGVPLSNGHYRDAQATASHPDIRVLGQKDIQNGRAHLWIDHRGHTWRRVVDGQAATPRNADIAVTLPGGRRGYRVEWWDTQAGALLRVEHRMADGAGVLRFAVSGLATDTAVKIDPLPPIQSWRLDRFGTIENAGPAANEADPDSDRMVNLWEYAWGADPLTPDAGRLHPPGLAIGEAGGYFTLTYRHSKQATDLDLVVEACSSLTVGDWSSQGLVEISRADAGEVWLVTVRDAVRMADHVSRFLRLVASSW